MRVYKRMKKAGVYWVYWRDTHSQMSHRWPAYPNNRTSESFGRNLEKLADVRSVGDAVPSDLATWIDALPPQIVTKLATLNLVELSRVASCEILDKHIEDYYDWRLKRGKGEKDSRGVVGRIRRVCKVATFNHWGDVQRGGPNALEAAIGKIQDADGLTDRTRNRFGMAFNAFGNWMVKQRRASHNPVRGWDKLSEPDSEYRRHLEPEEARRLIAAAEFGETLIGRTNRGRQQLEKHGTDLPEEVRWAITGHDRAVLYRVAIETGLRRGALERLTVLDFGLGSDPTVQVLATVGTKNPKTLIIPLKRETAKILNEYFSDRVPTAPAFRLAPDYKMADIIRHDLAAARAQWIDESQSAEERSKRHASDFLAAEDATGRRLDFHALRTTTASWLDHAGVSPAIAKRVTGHSSVATLSKHYHRATHAETRRAVESIATLDPLPLEATGTNGENEPEQVCQKVCQPLSDPVQRNKTISTLNPVSCTVNTDSSARGRTRTYDLRFRRPLL